MSKLRTLIQSFVNRFGYRFIRVKSEFAPKLLHFSDGDLQFDYWVDCVDSAQWYAPHDYSNDLEYQLMKSLVQPGDRVLEIGCNKGFTTMQLARFATESGFVLGVDVVPSNVITAQANVAQNRASHVTILHTAAGERQGEAGYVDQINGVMAGAAGFTAPMTTCDDLDERFGPFNVLKIDVEGYEKFVLQGAQKILARHPKLMLEIHGEEMEKFGAKVADVLNLIDLDRYAGKILERRPEIRVLPYARASVSRTTYPILFLQASGADSPKAAA